FPRPAAVDSHCWFIVDHLLPLREDRCIRLVCSHPLIEYACGRARRDRGAAPHHLIISVAICGNQSLANGEVEPLIMVSARVVVSAIVEQWNRRHAAAAAESQTALIGTLYRSRIRDRARGDVVCVLVIPAYVGIQIEELRSIDAASV